MEAINNYLVVKKEIIEEQRSEGGIILNVPSAFDFADEFTNKSICFAEVMYSNENIPFARAGERIVTNPHKGTKAAMDFEDYTVLTKEQIIAKIDKDGRFIVPENSVMIKMKKSDRESLFSKWIIRDDGSKVQLFIQSPPNKMDANRSEVFVSIGEITQIGENVKGLMEGDKAILDYTVDNFTDNVLYYDDEGDKYIVIEGTSTFHIGDTWAYANRFSPKDNLVSKKNDPDISSPLLGIIRGNKLMARQPYVFIDHRKNVIDKETFSGIIFSEREEIMERQVLSVSEESRNKYGIKEGQKIVVKDEDIFDIKLTDSKIQCILDSDVLMGKI